MKRTLSAFALTATAVLAAALSASASVHHGTFGNATTILKNRPDSGNYSPQWATDQIQRTTRVTSDGGSTWTVTITDEGSFATIPGGISPNDLGVTLTSSVKMGSSATIAGSDTFTVVATSEPDLSAVNGKTFTGSSPATSSWPELIFGAGNVISSVQDPWGWTYRLKCPFQAAVQTWVDASTGSTGNISGC